MKKIFCFTFYRLGCALEILGLLMQGEPGAAKSMRHIHAAELKRMKALWKEHGK